MKRPHGTSQRGMTMVELLFVLAMSGVLLLSIVTFARDTRFSLMRSEMNNGLLTRNRIIGTNLRAALSTSDLLLPRSAGHTYDDIQALVKASVGGAASTAAPAPVAFSMSPVIANSQEAELQPITAPTAVDWGNELIFVGSLAPVAVTVCYKNCGAITSATVQERVSIDRLQFVYFYLSQDPAAHVPGLLGGGLRLTEWRSQPFLDYQSLNSFASPRLTGTAKAAIALGYTWAFDRAQASTPATAFYQVTNSNVTPLNNTTGPPSFLAQSHWTYVDEYDLNANFKPLPNVNLGRIRRRSGSEGRIMGPANVIIALNTNQPTVNPSWKANKLLGPGKDIEVPAYALPDNGGANFPCGFEVSIWGKANARQVELRTVLMGSAGLDPRAPVKTYLATEALQSVAVKNE